MTTSAEAEQLVEARLRAALSPDHRIYANVRWISKPEADLPARDGETDLVIVHPVDGLLVIETKGGPIRRQADGRWFSGSHPIDPPPFKQAENSQHALVGKLTSLPDWPGRPGDVRAGHAVAFPGIAMASAHAPATAFGPDAAAELILDQEALASSGATADWTAKAFDFWRGDRRRGQAFTARQLELIDELLAPPPMELHPLLRRQIAEGEAEVVRLTRAQYHVLDMLRNRRRAAIVGPAGSGKTMLAAEKARRLAREGFRTLLVCFNQPLAGMLAEELEDVPAPAGLDVMTFHQLCLRLGREAGTLPREPAEKGQDWWEQVLPGALEAAIGQIGGRYHAIVVDEGQDFERSWLESLFLLLVDPDDDVFYVFHDPLQALYRDDVVDSLGLPSYPIEVNCRNPRPIHAYAAERIGGLEGVECEREGDRAPEVVQAAPGPETLEAVRKVLHQLAVVERVPPWQIVVLTGRSLATSDVWHQRQFGGQVLWNGAYDATGHSLGLAADDQPDQPSDTILCESVRRFKGLEREVVVLLEIDRADTRAAQLGYVGATRARQHLVVVG